MEDQLIDNPTEEVPKDVILGIIRWWERKRIWFNVSQVGIVLFVLFYTETDWTFHQLKESLFIFQSLLYFLFLNVCYSAGWGAHTLMYYYFKAFDRSHILDVILLAAGVLFTSWVTFSGYESFLKTIHYIR